MQPPLTRVINARMLRVTLSRPTWPDPALALQWDTLAMAAAAPAFLRWDWVGCLAEDRYPNPLLATVWDGTAVVGLALFNRRRDRLGAALFLHESGDPAIDSVFTEHNGPLVAPGHETAALDAILRAVRPNASRVVLSGVDDAALLAVRDLGGVVAPFQTRLAPVLHLGAHSFLESLSRNTRAQLRRSDRSYAESGPIVATRADTVPQALDWLGRLVRWHDDAWRGRGVVSGFTTAPVQRFHRALIGRGVATGVVDLLRIDAGARTIGYLLNLNGGGRVGAYQSGFDYAGAGPHEKPGLTCHAAAIARAEAAGAVEYDFLAGDARYKRSFANDVRSLHWLAWQRRLSIPGLAALLRKR